MEMDQDLRLRGSQWTADFGLCLHILSHVCVYCSSIALTQTHISIYIYIYKQLSIYIYIYISTTNDIYIYIPYISIHSIILTCPTSIGYSHHIPIIFQVPGQLEIRDIAGLIKVRTVTTGNPLRDND